MIENRFMKDVEQETLELPNKYDEVFSDLFDELGLHNKDIPIEGNVRQGMIGNTDVVVLQGDDNDLIIESLRTSDNFRGQGSAANALDKIIESAEKRNIILKAKILPEKVGYGLGANELKTFCEKRGFVFNENNEGVRIFNSK